MEVPKSAPTSGLFLEMGILPVQFVIEIRQLMFLKKLIARDPSDPVKSTNQKITGQTVFLTCDVNIIFLIKMIM